MPKSALLFGIFIASVAWPGLAVSQTSSGQKFPTFPAGGLALANLSKCLRRYQAMRGPGPCWSIRVILIYRAGAGRRPDFSGLQTSTTQY